MYGILIIFLTFIDMLRFEIEDGKIDRVIENVVFSRLRLRLNEYI